MKINQLDILKEVIKVAEGNLVLVPPTQVAETKVDPKAPVKHFAGAFLLSEDKETLVELRVFSDSFILFQTFAKGIRKGVQVAKGVTPAIKILQTRLGL